MRRTILLGVCLSLLVAVVYSSPSLADYDDIPIAEALEKWGALEGQKIGVFERAGSAFFREPVCKAIRSAPVGEKANAMCTQLKDSCARRFGPQGCWAGALQPAPNLRYGRFVDGGLRAEVFATTSAFFYRTLSNTYVQNTCCSTADNPNACRRQFLSTKLSIIDVESFLELFTPLANQGSFDNRGLYNAESNTVRIAAGALLRQFQHEGVADFVLHELGHACQAARGNLWIEELGLGLEAVDFFHYTPSQLAISELHGEKVSACIRSRLFKILPEFWEVYSKDPDKTLPAMSRKGIYRSWGREAFAEAFEYKVYLDVFAGARSGLGMSLFAWDCAAATDQAHGPARAVMECLLEDEWFHAQLGC